MKTVIVTLEVAVPDEVTDEDISDYVDVEFGQCGSRKTDNPCIGVSEVVFHSWRMED